MEITVPPSAPRASGWVCAKCGRSYGPLMMECKPCNDAVKARQTGARRTIVAVKP